MRYQYVPAQIEMREANEWLFTPAGRDWQDERMLDAGIDGHGMTRGRWFSIKEMRFFRNEEGEEIGGEVYGSYVSGTIYWPRFK